MSALLLPSGTQAFWVPLPALKSKSNYRHDRRNSSWKSLRSFEDEVAVLCRSALPSTWDKGSESSSVAERPGVVAAVCARTLLDAGNISKSVLDAVQGLVYVSDASVRAVTEIAVRASKDQSGAVAFALLSRDASLDMIARVASELPLALCKVWDTQSDDAE